MEGDMGKVSGTRLTLAELLANWREAILTCNLSKDRHMDGVTKWLILTRSCVFSMTLTSGLIGGLLAGVTAASGDVPFNVINLILAVVGILFAHAANNLINDYFDLEVGVDSSDNYARARYAPHPILSGMVSKAQLRGVILMINLIDASIMVYLTITVGVGVLLFALAGLFISVFYVAPPIRLKRIGLGELGVVLVWGPLMIGGTYYVTTQGAIDLWTLVASLPYAFLVGTVLMGKHIDKREQDGPLGIHSLPVILGHRGAILVSQIISVLFFVVVIALVAVGRLNVFLLLVLLAIPRLISTLKQYSAPKPAEYADSPLYYVGVAFYFTRIAGFLFIGGLILNLVFPQVRLPALF